MNRIYCLFVLILTSYALIAQQVDSIYAVADTIDLDTDRIEWLLQVAYQQYSIAPDITETIGKEALKQANEIGFELGIAKAHHILGIAYWTTAYFDLALDHNFQALRIYEKLNDKRRIVLIKMNNANIYGELGQTKKSISVLQDIIHEALIKEDSLVLGRAYNNISSEYKKIEQLDSMLYYLNIGLPYREADKDTLGIIGIKNNMGLAYNELKKPDQAIQALNRARTLLHFKPDKKRLSEVYSNLAKSYRLKGNLEMLKNYSDSCLKIALEIDDKRMQNVSYDNYSNYYSDLKNFEKSLEYFQLATAIRDTIFSQNVRKETEVLQLKFEDEKKAKQLAELEKQQAKDQLEFWMTAIILSAVILTAFLMIVTLRLKIKNSKLIAKDLQDQLDQKNRKLSSYALNFIQKNELLSELTDKIEELKKQSDTKGIKELNQMNGIISSSFRIDQDWENFRAMFEELHGNFFVRLKEQFPDLGNAEIKLCALLRLNMNLKESSKILGISADSVKTARYRLRKKLSLSTEDNLVDFLMKFDGAVEFVNLN